jgi:hypothetical protein
MRALTISLLLLLALPATTTCSQSSTSRPASQTLDEFWSAFRAAVAAKDNTAIASLSEFPFKTRGPLDSAPIVAHDRSSFLRMVDRMLDQDSGLKPEPDRMRELIKRTSSIQRSSPGGSSARLGAFVFQTAQGRWRFAMAYVDE